ncbi:hypothetical protein Tco_0418684 [Tanacetum coccineum]
MESPPLVSGPVMSGSPLLLSYSWSLGKLSDPSIDLTPRSLCAICWNCHCPDLPNTPNPESSSGTLPDPYLRAKECDKYNLLRGGLHRLGNSSPTSTGGGMNRDGNEVVVMVGSCTLARRSPAEDSDSEKGVNGDGSSHVRQLLQPLHTYRRDKEVWGRTWKNSLDQQCQTIVESAGAMGAITSSSSSLVLIIPHTSNHGVIPEESPSSSMTIISPVHKDKSPNHPLCHIIARTPLVSSSRSDSVTCPGYTSSRESAGR